MRFRWVAAIGAALVLSGCASTADTAATPTPTPEVSANQEACEAFADATAAMADRLNSDQPATDAWEAVRVDVDTAALAAEGDVKDRITALVNDWPAVSDIVIYVEGREAMNRQIDDIARACEADGAEVAVHTFVTD